MRKRHDQRGPLYKLKVANIRARVEAAKRPRKESTRDSADINPENASLINHQTLYMRDVRREDHELLMLVQDCHLHRLVTKRRMNAIRCC